MEFDWSLAATALLGVAGVGVVGKRVLNYYRDTSGPARPFFWGQEVEESGNALKEAEATTKETFRRAEVVAPAPINN